MRIGRVYKYLKRLSLRDDISLFLTKCGLTKRVAEIGVHKGKNFASILKCNPEKAFGIDAWGVNKESVAADDLEWRLRMYKTCLAKFGDMSNVTLIRALSVDGAKLFEDNSFDFVYIDAWHSYDCVKEDIEAWYPKVRVGGLIGGHDYKKLRNHGMGLIQAVHEFRDENNIQYFHHTHEKRYKSWYMLKCRSSSMVEQ